MTAEGVFPKINGDVLYASEVNKFVRNDGTLALTANWDVGSYEVRALKFYSDQATGTAPFTVASTTVVSNLNADLLDGYNTATASTASTVAVRDSSGNLTAKSLISDVATGTAPLTITSTTAVTNLNADRVDSLHSSSFMRSDASTTCSGTITIQSGQPLGKITLSTSDPSGGASGDLWLKY
jgi:hypothetical protein